MKNLKKGLFHSFTLSKLGSLGKLKSRTKLDFQKLVSLAQNSIATNKITVNLFSHSVFSTNHKGGKVCFDFLR